LTSQKNRTIGRSFRIEERWLSILNREAEREGISPNALMNKVLQDYCMFDADLSRFPTIILSQKSFSHLIASFPKEKLKTIGREAGIETLPDIFKTLGLELNQENIIYFIGEFLSRHAKWFSYNYHVEKKTRVFHLRHNFGENWNIFISEALSTVFENFVNVKPKIEFSKEAITIYLPNNEPSVNARA
jgi:hypothetical protein